MHLFIHLFNVNALVMLFSRRWQRVITNVARYFSRCCFFNPNDVRSTLSLIIRRAWKALPCCACANKPETRSNRRKYQIKTDGEDNGRRGVGPMRHSTSKSTSTRPKGRNLHSAFSSPLTLATRLHGTRNAFKNHLYESPRSTRARAIYLLCALFTFLLWNILFLSRPLSESFVSSTFVFCFRGGNGRSG